MSDYRYTIHTLGASVCGRKMYIINDSELNEKQQLEIYLML
jgi:hypothetical protein